MSVIRRREFITLLGSAGAAWPIAARAQQSAMPVIGFINGGAADATTRYLAAFQKGLREAGYVEGQNITVEYYWSDTVGKRLGLMGELVPSLRRWAVMLNAGFPDAVMELSEMQAAAKLLGLELTVLEIRRADDITPSFDGIKGRADALYVCVDPLVLANRDRINILALDTRLPTMHGFREYAAAGGLVSYGPNVPDLFRDRPTLSTESCGGRSPPTSQSSSRPSSIS